MQRFEPTSTITSDCFEVVVGVGRRVEAERLLVGDDRRGHALPRVAVAVHHAHAELGEAAEQRHFFGRDLSGAEKRDRLGAVPLLNRFQPLAEQVAIAVSQSTGRRRPASSRSSGVVARSAAFEHGQRFPAFGTGHAQVDGILACRASGRSPRRPSDGSSSEQPVEQKPQTIVVVASGVCRAGTCPSPKPPGLRSRSRVSGPSC